MDCELVLDVFRISVIPGPQVNTQVLIIFSICSSVIFFLGPGLIFRRARARTELILPLDFLGPGLNFRRPGARIEILLPLVCLPMAARSVQLRAEVDTYIYIYIIFYTSRWSFFVCWWPTIKLLSAYDTQIPECMYQKTSTTTCTSMQRGLGLINI